MLMVLFVMGLLPSQAAPSVPAGQVKFNNIPDQMDSDAFQISVNVFDGTGRPVPGAAVKVTLDPDHNKGHALFRSFPIYLKDASNNVVPSVTAVTDANGTATMWVRLNSTLAGFKACLQAEVTGQQQTMAVVKSNVFWVNRPQS